MNEVYSPESAPVRARARPLKENFTIGLLAVLFLALCSFLSLYRLAPPAAVAASAPPSEFSSGRALKHLEVISRRPHAVGTEEHAAVRDYLLQQLTALGLEPEAQKTTVARKSGGNIRVATVENVVARLKGTGAGRALLLVAHYDTVATSPGAGDDGSAVAALLETLRALKTEAPLANDVIFLFSDGEEIGLLGAEAFADEHRWSRDVGLVLNFESRGASGPVMMFETSSGNGPLIREFARVARRPTANSLAYEIYRVLPNNTDLTVFKGARLPGLNFANTDGFSRYHSSTDTPENLDERTLQHKGAYALALARHFGQLSLDNLKGDNAVYFDLLGATLLYYPVKLVLPLTVLAVCLFVAVAVFGVRRRRLTVGGILAGFLVFLLTVMVAAVVASVIWWMIGAVQRLSAASLQDDLYQSNIYLISFVAITIAVCTALSNLFSNRIRVENLAFGGMLCWLLLLVCLSVVMPGGSYLLAWPLLFGLFPFILMFSANEEQPVTTKRFLLTSLCIIPGIILLVPTVYQLHVALGLRMVGVTMILVVLLFGLLIPYFALMTSSRRWLWPAGAAVAGLLFAVLAAFTFSFDRQHPVTDNISYIQNVDLGKAVWASTDGKTDEWTAQFFRDNVERGSLLEYLPTAPVNFLKSPAPFVPLMPSEIKVLDDRTADGVRTLRLSLNSHYPSGYLMAPAEESTEVLATTVRGQRFVNEAARSAPTGIGWSLNYYALPAEGMELTLEVKPGRPLKLRSVDQAYELPALPGAAIKPRPDHIAPSSAASSDTAQISRAYTF